MHGWAHILEQAFQWLQRSAPRQARREGVSQVLDYSPTWKVISQLCWLFPIGLGVAAILWPPGDDERWLPAAIGGGFFALIIPLTLEVFLRRIDLTDQAISQRSPWSKPVKVAWKEVRDVSWKRTSNEVVIAPRNGRSIRVNGWLSGMETFALVLERRLAHLPATPQVVQTIRQRLGPGRDAKAK